MDVTINGVSPLRLVKVSKRKNNYKKAIRLNLINTWRIFIFSSIASFLSILLVNNGWHKINQSQIHITGNIYTDKNRVLNAIKVKQDLNIITINPKYLEAVLLQKLPFSDVKVNRRIVPPSFHIEVLERVPVAYATRERNGKMERGMIDLDGFWIPMVKTSKIKLKEEIVIDGWMKSHKNSIAKIFVERESLGSPLQRISISPSGEINLQTKDFKVIHLGTNQYLLNDQIKALPFLINSLPKKFTTIIQTNIDLRDPKKPKLLTP